MKAVIERFAPINIGGMVTRERAKLPCGCCIFVGLADGEASTGARPCTPEHEPVTDHASGLLRESTKNPKHALLVDVCRDILTQAAREMGA